MSDKKINILIELNSFDKGGLEKVVLDSALRFNKEKFNVFIVSIKNIGILAQIATANGIRVYTLEKFRSPFLKALYFIYIIIRKKIDISFSHFSHEGYKIYKVLNVPNITFIHNVYAFLDETMLKKLKACDKLVNTYISVSNNATRYAIKKIGLSEKKIITIPNGLIIEEHQERLKNLIRLNRSDFGLEERDYVFLNVASYNLHKAHYLIADAMKKVLKKRNDIKIICIGNIIVPAHFEEFKNYLKENHLEENILLPGHFINIEAFHVMSDAFLLPSFIEGWSIAMNEAMFYEKPMILSDTGGSKEVIENNDTGTLIENEYGDIINLDSKTLDHLAYEVREYRTSEKLASAMIDFADNKETWKKSGKKGKEKILNLYNFNDVVKKYEGVIFDILKR